MAESIHLKDPDGNGVELYADRPRDEWPTRNGELQLIMRPLDLDSLLATADEDSISAHALARTDIGHINLHVANLAEAEEFFRDFLGLEVTARIERSATFLATGGYHHHIAVNTWGGKMHPPGKFGRSDFVSARGSKFRDARELGSARALFRL